MESVLVVLALLACPLMMLAMGGIAWVTARFRGDSAGSDEEPQRLSRASRETDRLAPRP
jgi:hypothetical protein